MTTPRFGARVFSIHVSNLVSDSGKDLVNRLGTSEVSAALARRDRTARLAALTDQDQLGCYS